MVCRSTKRVSFTTKPNELLNELSEDKENRLNIPDLEDIVHALEDIRESCGSCSCDDEELGYHPPECGSTIEVRLLVSEDDWEVFHGDPGYDDQEGHWGSTTIASTDDDALLEQAAEQLIIQIEESMAEDEVWS